MGTDSSYAGMPSFTQSNGNVGNGVNLSNADRGNPNGDVVDNTAGENLAALGHENSLGTERGAYLNRYAKAPALYPNS